MCCFPVSSHIPWFSPICTRLNSPLFSFQRPFLTIRQNSLNVTVCMIACTFYQGYFIHSLSTLYYYSAPSLATRLTGDYRDRTYTGKCGPASLDTLHRKSQPQLCDQPLFYLLYFLVRSPSDSITCCIAFCPVRLAISSFFSFSFARTDSF